MTGSEIVVQRYYASTTGRFLTPDPYRSSGGPADPQSWNRYTYVLGDPVNFYDPAGLEAIPANWCTPGAQCVQVTERAVDLGYTSSLWFWLYRQELTGNGFGTQKPEYPRESVATREAAGIGLNPGNESPCPPVPIHSSSSDIGRNISEAEQRNASGLWPLAASSPLGAAIVQTKQLSALIWFYEQVRNGGAWDYKQDKSGNYQDFGNFNYGATGAAMGLPEELLLRMAGWAQTRAGTSKPEWGTPFGSSPPYGDDPADQAQIRRGYQYYRALKDGNCP